MKKYIKAVLTLVIVVTFSTVAIWGVNSVTAPIVTERANKEAAKAYTALVNDKDASGKDVTGDFKGLEAAGITAIMELTLSDGKVVYGMQVTATGYHEGLNYAVAVDPEAKTFYGIKVISHGETNGKGSVVLADADYLNYFKGLSLEATFDSTSAATDVTTGSSVTSKGMDTSIAKVAEFVLDNMVGGGN